MKNVQLDLEKEEAKQLFQLLERMRIFGRKISLTSNWEKDVTTIKALIKKLEEAIKGKE